MQTFLPYPDYEQSAACLDRARLGKQRVETLQLLNSLTGKSTGWANHPASKMWRNNIHSLATYGVVVCREWLSRGYNDSCLLQIITIRSALPDTGPPKWLGDPAFHRSHQSNLIRKLPSYYQPLWPDVSPFFPYVWPT